MESFGGGSFKIEKLGESNFHVWKQKVELVLSFRELDIHIRKDAQEPTENDEKTAWQKND